MKADDSLPKPTIEEPLERYFQSPAYQRTFKKITFSTSDEQEQAHRDFCFSLTPEQRLGYLQFLNRTFIPDYDTVPVQFCRQIVFS